MTRPQQRLLAQLATSPNEIASGLGQCLEALRLISTLPRTSPVFVHYTSATSTPAVKAFGREHLSRVPLRTVIALLKTSFSLTDPIRVTTALFYREDGSIDPTPAFVDEDSWKELAPYVHTLHVEDDEHDRSTSSTVLSPLSSLAAISASTVIGPLAHGLASSSLSTPSSSSLSKPSGLNSNASAFVPATTTNGITVKTTDGTKIQLQGLRKSTGTTVTSALSPSSPQATSPFAILDNTGGCI